MGLSWPVLEAPKGTKATQVRAILGYKCAVKPGSLVVSDRWTDISEERATLNLFLVSFWGNWQVFVQIFLDAEMGSHC